MTLRVREAGTIDEVLLRPEHDDQDWNDVLAGYGLAEELASTQPWLARWKEKSGGRIAVFLPAGIHDLSDRHSILELWEEVALGGTPELALSFRLKTSVGMARNYFNGGLGVLSTDGTLMILRSSGTHGPLAGVAPPGTRFRATGHYGLVLPGGDLEVRVREQ
jgi:hypothetical protein